MIASKYIMRKKRQGFISGIIWSIVIILAFLVWEIRLIYACRNGENVQYNSMFTTPVVVLKKDIIRGEVITEDIIEVVNVSNKIVPSSVCKKDEVIGKISKYSIEANLPLTTQMIYAEDIPADIRSVELSYVIMPSDLKRGDVVDIRYVNPNGVDVILISHKTVDKIRENSFWVKLNEEEIKKLSKVLLDIYLNKNTKLYALKYIDPNIQINE